MKNKNSIIYNKIYNNNGILFAEQFTLDGKPHNENGPAYIEYYENGKKRREEYWINNKLHNKNGAAIISYYKNGNKQYEEYYMNGKLHNKNKAARIFYYKNNVKQMECFVKNSFIHNKNGAAYIEYHKDGSISKEEYWIKGYLNKVISYENNIQKNITYYFNGFCFSSKKERSNFIKLHNLS